MDILPGGSFSRLNRDHRIFVVIALGWFFSVGIRYLFPTLLPELQSAFDLTLTTAGLLIPILWSAYAIGHSNIERRYPVGVRHPETRVRFAL
jgi:fucose permease